MNTLLVIEIVVFVGV